MADAERTGVLLSTSVTTGWLHWLHGELWLFPDGLLHVPLGWVKSWLLVGYFFNVRSTNTRSFGASEFMRLISDRRNMWISKDMIVSATLRHSLGADELRAQLADGRSVQLLWLPKDGAFETLQAPLHEWLDERLAINERKLFLK